MVSILHVIQKSQLTEAEAGMEISRDWMQVEMGKVAESKS